ncbi:MAG: phosphatase PAP2 family protein [Candidatus Micrarchaeia archaeon]
MAFSNIVFFGYAASSVFEEGFVFLVAGLAIIALLFIKRENKLPLVFAIVLTFLLVTSLKGFFNEPRPCNGFDFCPPDSGFPSGHSAAMFVLAVASMGSFSFYFFFPLALAIAFSRYFFGVHTSVQVVAGAVTGLVVFLVFY